MKIMKILYFGICFSLTCLFFYFFCNSDQVSNGNSSSLQKPNDAGKFPSLIAYFRSSEQDVIEKCEDIKAPNENVIKSMNGQWQDIPEASVFLYSAFYDDRYKNKGQTENFIRVLGMPKGISTRQLYCQVWYNNETPIVSKVQQEEIWFKNWDYANSSQFYRPYILSCPVNDSHHNSPPTSVSLVVKPCQKAQNRLLIHSNTFTDKKDFAVCLKALDFTQDVSLRLLEWIELQYLLGADKISTYVFAVHPNITKVLEYYQTSGKLSIKYHTLPGEDPNDPVLRSQFLKTNIWQKRRHEIIPYNDCLYNHIHSHKYVVILDLDEAIIPMMHRSWAELLEHVFSDHTNALQVYSSLSATNVYFFDEFGEYTDDITIPPYMHMLRHVYRSANFSSPGFAVKSFHATNNTLAVFNHYTLFPLYPELRRNALIGRHLAQLHHYRATCPPLMDKECQTNFMKFYKKDTVLWKFKDLLINNVKRVAKELQIN